MGRVAEVKNVPVCVSLCAWTNSLCECVCVNSVCV